MFIAALSIFHTTLLCGLMFELHGQGQCDVVLGYVTANKAAVKFSQPQYTCTGFENIKDGEKHSRVLPANLIFASLEMNSL